MVSSCTLIALALEAGLSTLPPETLALPETTRRYQAQADIGFWEGHQAPAFVFEESLFPHQCGSARVTAERSIVLSPYASCSQRLGRTSTVRLHPANLQLLWSLVPENERDVLEAQAWALGQQLASPLLKVLDSAYFKQTYSVELRLIFQDALRKTWETPTVQVALAQAIQAVDPNSISRLVNSIWPVAVEKTKSSLWHSLSDMTDALLMDRRGEALEGSVTGRIFQEIFKDPRSRAYLFNTLLQLMNQPEVVSFTALFTREISATLIADPRLSALFDRAMTDPQLASISNETGLNLDFLIRDLPRSLLRYRRPKDHNPLVSYLVRSIVRRENGFVVLMLTDKQIQSVTDQGMRSGIVLTEEYP